MNSPKTAILATLKAVKKAAQELRSSKTATKNTVLLEAARLLKHRQEEILAANAQDLAALPADSSNAFRDRLALDPKRVEQMITGLEQVALLPDPVDEITEFKTLSNGLKVSRVRAPLGVILMIFESRPNVAVEAFSLALKSGNVIILRGGKESMHTTTVLYSLLGEALSLGGLSGSCLWGITDPDRSLIELLLKQATFIDVVVPRGGSKLIEFVVENARMPIIKNDRGLCHVYVHDDADLEMAIKIVVNAKTQRPGVCNAMETLLVHRDRAGELIPKLYEKTSNIGLAWFCCPQSAALLKGRTHVHAATQDSWDTEYLDLKMNCKIVDSLEDAMAHIEMHGSRHSEAIVTNSFKAAKVFQSSIDAAAVYWNASTRFTDGFELGLGGELGISTQKLHVRGPVGLRELTSLRWIIDGEGQTRA